MFTLAAVFFAGVLLRIYLGRTCGCRCLAREEATA